MSDRGRESMQSNGQAEARELLPTQLDDGGCMGCHKRHTTEMEIGLRLRLCARDEGHTQSLITPVRIECKCVASAISGGRLFRSYQSLALLRLGARSGLQLREAGTAAAAIVNSTGILPKRVIAIWIEPPAQNKSRDSAIAWFRGGYGRTNSFRQIAVLLIPLAAWHTVGVRLHSRKPCGDTFTLHRLVRTRL
jgi:hypothetical protein